MEATPTRRQRVPALSPDERRAALIQATIPLLREYGPTVTTRQIADAAGVAEGTIFGVYPDKASLIRAAVIAALDSGSVLGMLQNIDPAGDLRSRLVAVVELLRQRIAINGPLVNVIRTTACAPNSAWPPAELMLARQRMVLAIAAVIEPDRDLLRHPPETTARLLQSMVMSSGRGFFGEPEVFDARELVTLLLDGLLKQAVGQAAPPPAGPDAHPPAGQDAYPPAGQAPQSSDVQAPHTQETSRADSTAA